MKHLEIMELTNILMFEYDSFWADPVFVDLKKMARRLDEKMEELNELDQKRKVKGVRGDYKKLQKDNPAYDRFLSLARDDAEAYLYGLDRKSLQKLILELGYKKSLLSITPFKMSLHNLLVDVNYKIVNYGKRPSAFGIDPNYVKSQGPVTRGYNPHSGNDES